MHYTRCVGEDADWRYRGDYIAKHHMTPALAIEALTDPNRLVLDPDSSSLSGRTQRIIGWCHTVTRLVTVIVLPDEDTLWGVNAWYSNSTDQRRYREEQP